MTPEEKKLLEDTAKTLKDFLEVYYKYNLPTRQVIIKDMDLEGVTKIKNAQITKFGLGLTPVAQQADIVAPTGGGTVDAEARTAINSIRAVLDAFGFTA